MNIERVDSEYMSTVGQGLAPKAREEEESGSFSGSTDVLGSTEGLEPPATRARSFSCCFANSPVHLSTNPDIVVLYCNNRPASSRNHHKHSKKIVVETDALRTWECMIYIKVEGGGERQRCHKTRGAGGGFCGAHTFFLASVCLRLGIQRWDKVVTRELNIS
ncbi:hypothetical protein AAC387_Pa02g3501 [Persea americana]